MRTATVMLALVGFAGSVHAYVRTTSERSGRPLFWGVRCLPMQPDARGSQDLPLSTVQQSLAQAARNWSGHTNACSSLVVFGVPPAGVLDAQPDDQHLVTFRDHGWDDSANVVAKTVLWHLDVPGSVNDGLILDADIKLNGTQFTFITDAATAARVGTDVADLEGTLTHELGHVMGLQHTCWDEVGPQPVDDQGQPVPTCGGPLPPSVTQATMYPYTVPPGSTAMRQVSDDDVRGICGPYPAGSDAACFNHLQGGCSMATTATSGPGWLWLVVALSFRRARGGRPPDRSDQ